MEFFKWEKKGFKERLIIYINNLCMGFYWE